MSEAGDRVPDPGLSQGPSPGSVACITPCYATPMSDEPEDRSAGERDSARKERVLHTRVPELLADELKKAAEAMRVPVSNLVRTVLEDAVSTLAAVNRRTEGELLHLAQRLPASASSSAAPAATPDAPLAGIVGFQPMALAKDAACTLCGTPLAAGNEAFLGIRAEPGPLVIVDAGCLPGGAAGSD